ncbi:MAG: hypothetical protein JW770_06710 [Actinobacteria bacterium]|nr:hypothetical protein [Actinomycetota bacterium]
MTCRFFYGRRLLLCLLDYYFSGAMTGEYESQVIRIGGRNWGFEGMSALKADIARAISILDLDEKVVLALRHSGHTFYEITRLLHIGKRSAIDIYGGAIIRIIVYLNGPMEDSK